MKFLNFFCLPFMISLAIAANLPFQGCKQLIQTQSVIVVSGISTTCMDKIVDVTITFAEVASNSFYEYGATY